MAFQNAYQPTDSAVMIYNLLPATRVQVTGRFHAWSEFSHGGHPRPFIAHRKRKSVPRVSGSRHERSPAREGELGMVAQLRPARCVVVEISRIADSGGHEVASLVSSADDGRASQHIAMPTEVESRGGDGMEMTEWRSQEWKT